ncbi:MAG: OTU domain-containing protein [Chlamydiia bacterium]
MTSIIDSMIHSLASVFTGKFDPKKSITPSPKQNIWIPTPPSRSPSPIENRVTPFISKEKESVIRECKNQVERMLKELTELNESLPLLELNDSETKRMKELNLIPQNPATNCLWSFFRPPEDSLQAHINHWIDIGDRLDQELSGEKKFSDINFALLLSVCEPQPEKKIEQVASGRLMIQSTIPATTAMSSGEIAKQMKEDEALARKYAREDSKVWKMLSSITSTVSSEPQAPQGYHLQRARGDGNCLLHSINMGLRFGIEDIHEFRKLVVSNMKITSPHFQNEVLDWVGANGVYTSGYTSDQIRTIFFRARENNVSPAEKKFLDSLLNHYLNLISQNGVMLGTAALEVIHNMFNVNITINGIIQDDFFNPAPANRETLHLQYTPGHYNVFLPNQ